MKRRKKRTDVHFYSADNIERHLIGRDLAERVTFPARDDPKEEVLDQAVKDAAQTFFTVVATLEQDRLIETHWDILFPIITKCITCGINTGAEHHTALAKPHTNKHLSKKPVDTTDTSVKIYEDRHLASTEAMPESDSLICTAADMNWANKIADAIMAQENTGVVLVTADGYRVRKDP